MKSRGFSLESYIRSRGRLIERELDRLLPPVSGPGRDIARAMRHSVLGGGKRLRPLLVLAGAEAAGGRIRPVLPLAAAFEFLHTYSLIHDDLPAMDDDDLRRGRPTCHKKFGEANAILAGDALHSLAFEVLAGSGLAPARIAEAGLRLARAAGCGGMVGGQAMDLAQAGKRLSEAGLRRLHGLKTGALLSAAVSAGAEASGAPRGAVLKFEAFGRLLGLAFQVVDDVLDVEGTPRSLGKTPGKDRAQAHFTYVDLMGAPRARTHARALASRALRALPRVRGGDLRPLAALAGFVVERTH